jgi:hypothetical protein
MRHLWTRTYPAITCMLLRVLSHAMFVHFATSNSCSYRISEINCDSYITQLTDPDAAYEYGSFVELEAVCDEPYPETADSSRFTHSLQDYQLVVWDLSRLRSRLILFLSQTVEVNKFAAVSGYNFTQGYYNASEIWECPGPAPRGKTGQCSQFIPARSFLAGVALYRNADFPTAPVRTEQEPLELYSHLQADRLVDSIIMQCGPCQTENVAAFTEVTWSFYDRTMARKSDGLFDYGIPSAGESNIFFSEEFVDGPALSWPNNRTLPTDCYSHKGERKAKTSKYPSSESSTSPTPGMISYYFGSIPKPDASAGAPQGTTPPSSDFTPTSTPLSQSGSFLSTTTRGTWIASSSSPLQSSPEEGKLWLRLDFMDPWYLMGDGCFEFL